MLYQCPLGLGLHFYVKHDYTGADDIELYQCPFGLVLHFYEKKIWDVSVLWCVSMPFRAKAPFLQEAKQAYIEEKTTVSMPFRAKAPFLQNDNCQTKVERQYNVSMPFRASAPFLRNSF